MANVEIPTSVIQKLIFFTVMMIFLPITTFFVLDAYTNGNHLISGGSAAVMANVVLVGYLIVAFTEEIPDEKEKKEK